MNIHPWLAEWSSWLWPNVWVHLWEATLFVGIVALAVRLLRRAPAGIRYFFWLSAAVKLLIPSILLAWLLSEFFPAAPALSSPSLEQSVNGTQASDLGKPVYAMLKPLLLSPPPVAHPVSSATHNEFYCALTLAWLTGFVFILVRWARSSLRLARVVGAGDRMVSSRETETLYRVRSWLQLKQDVAVVTSDRVSAAGLWGIRRPTVLLPKGAARRLSDEELEAVMLHELLHVERRDNLAVILHKFLLALLWFYPLMWLLDGKLFEERERACDEEVVRLRQSPKTYISGILKVVRACVEQQLDGTSSIGGSSLERRIRHLLTTGTQKKLSIPGRTVVVGFAASLVIFSVGAGLANRDANAAWSLRDDRYPLRIHTSQQGPPNDASVVVQMSCDECGPVSKESMRYYLMGSSPLEQRSDLPILFRNPTGSPLLITDARVKAMKIEEMGAYLLLPRVSFSSQTTKKIAAVRLKFQHALLRRSVHAEMYQLELEPHGVFSTDRMPGETAQRFLHRGLRYFPPRALLDQDPAKHVFDPYAIYLPLEKTPEDVTVSVQGVQFADDDTWGTVPARFPIPTPPIRFPQQALWFGLPAAVDTQTSSKRVRVNEDEQRKKIGYLLEPPCPSHAFSMGIDGALVLEATIGKDGSVQALRTVDGEPRLYGHVVASVVEAVKQWRYEPTFRQGKPVQVVTTITIKFVLDASLGIV